MVMSLYSVMYVTGLSVHAYGARFKVLTLELFLFLFLQSCFLVTKRRVALEADKTVSNEGFVDSINAIQH